MDPFTSNQSSFKAQQEIADRIAAWDDEPSPPSLTSQMIWQIALMLGELLIVAGVKLRNLYAENLSAPVGEQPCESPC